MSATQEMTEIKPEIKHELTLTFEFSPQGIGNLFGALAKAQKAFKPVKKTSKNPFFKSNYADLAEVIEATREGLSDNEIAVIQPPCFRRSDGTVVVHTFMAHSSGEWVHSILDMPIAKVDAQGVGAGITYGRRYAFSGTVNVASEEDDDGNGAVTREFKKNGKAEESPEEFDQRTEAERNITLEQLQELDKAVKRTGKTEDEVKAALGFIGEKRMEHIKRGAYQKFLKWANGTGKAKGPTVAEQDRVIANKKLWAVAAEFSIPDTDVKTCAYEKYGVSSMTELTAAQLLEMTQWVKDVADQQTA